MPYAVAAAGIAAGGAVYSADQAKSAQQGATNAGVGVTREQLATSRSDLAPYRDAGSAALGRLRALLGVSDTGGAVTYGGQTYANADQLRTALRNDYLTQLKAKGLVDQDATVEQAAPRISEDSINNVVAQAVPVQAGSADFGSSPLLRKFNSSDLAADPVYNSGLQFGLDEGTKAIARKAAAGGGYDSGAEDKAIARFASDYGSTKAADAYGRFTADQNSAFGKLSGVAGLGSGATTVGVGAGGTAGSNLASLYSGQGNANAAASIASGNAIGGAATGAANYYQQKQLLAQLSGGGQRTTTPALDPSTIPS